MKNSLTQQEQSELLEILRERFEMYLKRHPTINWEEVETKLLENPQKLWSLFQMEKSSGEPDLVIVDPSTSQYAYVDCAEESPKGRRSLCYDQKALGLSPTMQPVDFVQYFLFKIMSINPKL